MAIGKLASFSIISPFSVQCRKSKHMNIKVLAWHIRLSYYVIMDDEKITKWNNMSFIRVGLIVSNRYHTFIPLLMPYG